MADLKIQDFETLVRNQVLAIQGKSTSLVDLTVGSILRALVEAYSAIAIWLQAMILQVVVITRASTSSGVDLDSWMGDYGVLRTPATFSSGIVTFSRFTYTSQAVIPTGSIVQSADGSQQYVVVADATRSSYNSQIGGYVIPADTQSLDAPVQSVNTGTATNASIGGVNTLGQAIPGIDTVTNAAAFTNGADAELDADLRKRFVAWLLSLSKATEKSISYAATSLKSGITCKIIQNQNYDGSVNLGFFYVVVDDGTGSPSSSLLSSVYGAIESVRGLSIRFAVFAPIVNTVNITMSITASTAHDQQAVAATVAVAIRNYINSLGLGNPLLYTKLVQVAYESTSGVGNVTSVRVNGDVLDIAADSKTVIKAGIVSIG